MSTFTRRLKALKRAQIMRRNSRNLMLKRKRIQHQREVHGVSMNDALKLAIRHVKLAVKEKLARGREWKDVDDTTYNRYIRWLSGPGPLRAARKLVSAYKAKYNAPKSDNSSWHNTSAVQM